MLVYVDEQAFEVGLGPDSTVCELVDEVRTSMRDTERLVMGIQADGLDITGDNYSVTLGKPVSSFSRYDFVTADPHEVVREALSECLELLVDADARRSETIDLLTRGENNKGIEGLGACCRTWQQVYEGIRNAMSLLKLDPGTVRVAEVPLDVVLAGSREQLSQLCEALRARDFVLVSDILQYEFDPTIESWHAAINAILQITQNITQQS